MASTVSLLLAGLASLPCALALTGQQIAAGLKPSLSSGSAVYLASDSQYAKEVTPRWDVYDPPTYVVAVKPAIVEDVQAVIKYASKNNVPFLATGAGHGYTNTLSALQNGLVLDMGNFKNVTIDSANNLMTVGGGTITSYMSAALQDAGKEIPVGQCPCIGMTGYTLGGGIGPYSGLHGPASDSVASIEMVTGNGNIVNVSATQNPDLFWGMRGAGFNYGVVTSLTYNVYNATNGGQAMNADMMFSASQNASVFALAKSFVGKQPKELSITFSLSYNATLSEVAIVANFIYAGPVDTGKSLIKPFLDLNPVNLNISTVPWKDIPTSALYGATSQGCSASQIDYVPYSLNLYQIDVDNMSKLVNFMNTSMSADPSVQTAVIALAQYSSVGLQSHEDDSSAFPFRDAVIFAQIDGFGLNSSFVPSLNKWGDKVRTLMQQGSGKDDLEVYLHFAHGDEGPESWYTSEKLPKLRSLKTKYDPHGLFSYYNPVQSAGNSTARYT